MKPLPAPNSDFEPALELARLGRLADAIQCADRILTAAPSREALATPAALALAAIARQAQAAQDLRAAERALESALKLKPQFADLQYQLACVLIDQKRRLEARRALEKAVAINPKYVAARVELAMLDAREGMIGEALAALRALSSQTPIDDLRTFSQGMRRLEHAEWDEADALIRRALHLSDEELKERIERFHALMMQDEPAQAAEVLREVLPRHESYPDLHYRLGMAELRLGHVDDAIVSLGRALELNPDFAEARVQFALALDASGMSAAALDQMGLVLQQDAENREADAFVRAHEARSARTSTHG